MLGSFCRCCVKKDFLANLVGFIGRNGTFEKFMLCSFQAC